DVGKPLGIDLKEKKMTLPLIAALRTAERSERQRILRIVRKRKQTRADVRAVSAFVEEHGGIAYARRLMLDHAAQARELLESFPETEARTAMVSLIDYSVTRKK